MPNNIFLIFEKDPALGRKLVFDFFKSLEIPEDKIIETTAWKIGIGKTLDIFGNRRAIFLNISDQKDLTAFREFLKKNKEEFSEKDSFGLGTVIWVTNKRSGGDIKKLVDKWKGTVISSDKPETTKEDILKETGLSRSTKDFLSAYVGLDYALLLPVLNSLEKYTKEEQEKLTPTEILAFMPKIRGEIKPWEFLNAMERGNLKQALIDLNTIMETTSYMLAFTMLKNKLELVIRSGSLYNIGVRQKETQEKILGANPWAFRWPYNIARGKPQEVFDMLAKEVRDTEAGLKGENRLDGEKQVMQLLVKSWNILGA